MNREHHKWWSSRLNRDMELLVFGHAGQPVLVFPSSMGKFYEYEDRGMVDAIGGAIAHGHVQLFCVDSVDTESWYCKWAHPSGRVWRHVQYEGYVMHEVLPLMRQRCGRHRVAVTGASFGGFHCTNFALRHPDCVSHCISMSGAYDIHSFLDGYWDDNCYFNCPTAYLPNTSDPWYLDQYRNDIHWIFAAGEHDICRAANEQIAAIFNAKGISHWYDQTGDLGMVLQEGIDFTGYYRCFVVGGQDVLVMPYDPRQPHEHRYVRDVDVTKDPLYERICGDARKLCNALGYEMNTVEFAVRDGVPYAIDYLNPAPDADRHSVGETNFEWIVSKMAEFAVRTVLDPASATAGYRWANYLDRTR